MVVVGYAWSRTAKVAAFSGEKCIHFGRLLLCFTFLCIAMGSSAFVPSPLQKHHPIATQRPRAEHPSRGGPNAKPK